jgi:hypothetical protein
MTHGTRRSGIGSRMASADSDGKSNRRKKPNYGEPEPRIAGIRTRIMRHSGKTMKASPNEMIIWMTETWNT